MNDLSTVVLFVLVIFIALFSVSAINRYQTRSRVAYQRLQKLKRAAADIEETIAGVLSLLGESRIPEILKQEEVEIYEAMLTLSNNDPSLEIAHENAMERLQSMRSDPRAPINRLRESDLAIAQAHHFINEAARILQKRFGAALLTPDEYKSLTQELLWAQLMVTTISFVAQGHKATNRNDPAQAYAFYKKAVETARHSTINDDRRLEIIRELGDIMAGRRSYLSVHLMPETHYNPLPIKDTSPQANGV